MFVKTGEGRRSGGKKGKRETDKKSYYEILKPLKIFKRFWKIVQGLTARVLQSYFIWQESTFYRE